MLIADDLGAGSSSADKCHAVAHACFSKKVGADSFSADNCLAVAHTYQLPRHGFQTYGS